MPTHIALFIKLNINKFGRKVLIIIQLIMISTLGFSQDWSPIGAKWYYDHFDGVGLYLTIIESTKDTVISDKLCKELQTSLISERMRQDGTCYWDTTNIIKNYLYFSQDTIYHYYENEFYPLYIFNLQQNDTILVSEGNDCDQLQLDYYYYCYRFEYVVDSIKTLSINGQELKLIYNSPTEDSDWEFNHSWNHNPLPIIEKIGSTKFFFGTHRDSFLEGDINCLRCYVDNTLIYKADYWSKDCDYLRPLNSYPSISELKEFTISEVYPNPFNSQINIHSNGKIDYYTIFDFSGQLILRGNKNIIETEVLPNGIYFLKLIVDNHEVKTIKLIKQFH